MTYLSDPAGSIAAEVVMPDRVWTELEQFGTIRNLSLLLRVNFDLLLFLEISRNQFRSLGEEQEATPFCLVVLVADRMFTTRHHGNLVSRANIFIRRLH